MLHVPFTIKDRHTLQGMESVVLFGFVSQKLFELSVFLSTEMGLAAVN